MVWGISNHDVFQERLKELSGKYNLKCITEYTSKKYFDKESNSYRKGRIDITYFKNNEPYLALEIDMGIKGKSIKKLLANDEFKYRIWFCYNRKVNSKKYYEVINRLDVCNEIIYITANRWHKKSDNV